MKLTDVEVFGEPPKKYYKWFRSENIKRPWWDKPKKKNLLKRLKDFWDECTIQDWEKEINKTKEKNV